MPAYVIARMSIHDPETYKKYTDLTPPIVKKYGGKFLTRGEKVTTIEAEFNITPASHSKKPMPFKRVGIFLLPKSEIPGRGLFARNDPALCFQDLRRKSRK